MDNTSADDLMKQGQAFADKAADKAAELRGNAAPTIKKVTGEVRTLGKQSMSAASDMVDQARDAASAASDSIVAYTKANPVKALAIAVTSGALLYAAVKAFTLPRD